MKKYFYLFFVLPVLAFGQIKKDNYDYFVQFNTHRFAQKVNIDSLLNHKAIKTITGEEAKAQLSEFSSFIDKSKAVTLHGNFTDTIPYYQINMPLLDVKGLNGFIQKKVDQSNETKSDSIPATIKMYPKYRIYSPKNADYTLAWDDKNLVVFGLLNANKRDHAMPVGEVSIDSLAVVDTAYAERVNPEEVVVDMPVETQVVDEAAQAADTAAVVIEATEPEVYDDEYYKKIQAEYEKASQLVRIERQIKQETQLAMLFENGYVVPTSDKVKADSDISIWVNYQSVLDKMSRFNYLYPVTHTVPFYESKYSTKGMNADFYFENEKARIEQSIELSEPMAKIMRKMISKKTNKNTFKFFPGQEPLAYMSYHVNTAEVLKNYPLLMEETLSKFSLERQDVEIITDLFSTIIDEEAAATILDGDISMFLHNIKSYEETIASTTYNDEYEEVKEEKTITKTKPVFSVVVTSTHPTMADKLLNLGLRKNLFQKVNDYYLVKKSEEIGGLIIKKEGDVLVFTNELEHTRVNQQSDFSKKVKKNLSKNYMYGNFDVRNFIKNYFLNQDLGKDTAKFIQLSNRFKNIEFKASNKLEDNRMKMQIELNSNLSDKNIILQTLDLINLLK